MMAPTPAKSVTVDEYLELEVAAETRSEYRQGAIVPTTGGTPQHNQISGNLYIALSLALKRRPYTVFHLDQRLWIPDATLYTYPDVMAIAQPLQLQPGRTDTVVNPCFLAEVLSRSTKNYDRGEKFAAYRTLASLQEYLLLEQSRCHVEHYVKMAANQWLLSEYDDPAIALCFRTFELQVPIADLYDEVEFADFEGDRRTLK